MNELACIEHKMYGIGTKTRFTVPIEWEPESSSTGYFLLDMDTFDMDRLYGSSTEPGMFLIELLETYPHYLGDQEDLGDLPFMFKVLSINKALSIQVPCVCQKGCPEEMCRLGLLHVVRVGSRCAVVSFVLRCFI